MLRTFFVILREGGVSNLDPRLRGGDGGGRGDDGRGCGDGDIVGAADGGMKNIWENLCGALDRLAADVINKVIFQT